MGMEARSLVRLTIFSTILVGGLAFPPLIAGESIVWGTVLATALANAAAGNVANAIDALTEGKDPSQVSLQNQDLTNAVGKAIAAVITLEAKQQPRDIRRKLEKIAAQAKHNWVKIAQRELTQQRYPELREGKLDQFLTPEEYSLTQTGNLTPQEWGDIFIRLNMEAKQGGGFSIPQEVREQVAKLLHTTFPKALQETLKADFAQDGTAFAGLTLQLLTGMKAELEQQRNTTTEDLTPVFDHLQQLETQLQGTAEQQQAFFQHISQQIESGFAEVCHQLQITETNITHLLQGLGITLEQVEQDVAEILSRLDPLHPQLSLEQWQIVARKMLLKRQELTSNLFTRSEFNRVEIYVPLGLVERREQKQQLSELGQPPEREEEKITPIAEDEFFTRVLQQGQSPKSQGRRIVIIGEPGSGKTTRLQAIADWILDNNRGLPIWIPLADFTQPTLVHYLEDIWLKQAGIPNGITSLMQQKDHIWFLLDGLDEMTARVESRHVDQLLTGWTGESRAIVTCRVNVWEADRNAFSGFDVYRNLPFEADQMETFIRRFFAQSD